MIYSIMDHDCRGRPRQIKHLGACLPHVSFLYTCYSSGLPALVILVDIISEAPSTRIIEAMNSASTIAACLQYYQCNRACSTELINQEYRIAAETVDDLWSFFLSRYL